jgi:hypothetical protein
MAKFAYSQFVHTQQIIQKDLPKIATDKQHVRLFETFRKYSQLSEANATYVLSFDNGPSFELKPIGVGVWGEVPQYPPPPKGRTIWINPVLVQQYESIKSESLKATSERESWKHLASLARLFIESTLLHELVHWGDLIDGNSSDPDAREIGYNDIGHQFVHEAYDPWVPMFRTRRRGMVADKDIAGWMGWDANRRPYGLYGHFSHFHAPLPTPPLAPWALHPR